MSGAGTNSGINYQQRIAALALVAQYTDFDLSRSFGVTEQLEIESTHFETDDPIDDLKIKCKSCILFLQIKRSLSLQIEEGTDFYKTLDQFVVQYFKKITDREYYILVTSSNSSGSIINELSKITESIRLNDEAFNDNPLNKSEKETLNKFRTLFFLLFKKNSEKNASEKDFIAFSKRIFISVIDIESGRPNEQVAIILLTGKKLVDSELVWNTLIANCLEYARKRQSVDRKAIENILKRYIVNDQTESDEFDELKEYFQTEIIQNGRFPVAKEVLIIESFVDSADYLITELYRFSDEGKIKHEFRVNKIRLENSSTEWTVIQRAATFAGINRFLEDNKARFENKRITIIPSNPEFDIEESENTPIAELHRKYLQELAQKNKDFLKCLHCDKSIDPDNSLLIEVDDVDSKPAMGVIHIECLRPIDRITGISGSAKEEPKDFLKSFDYKTWARLIMKGQGLMNGLKSSTAIQNRPHVIAWSANEIEFRDYSYCISFVLQDGSSIHMTDRGRIHRFNKPEAEEAKTELVNSIKKDKERGDPKCYTSINHAYGNRSQLMDLKEENETIIEIESVEVTRYSKLLERREEDILFYAPICILRHREEETLLNFGNAVPLISDPLSFERIYNTWKNIGFDITPDDIELKIIKSDLEFDSYMREFFGTGMAPIIDPLFNEEGEIEKGIRVIHREQLMAQQEEYRKPVENPNWRKGDKVQLMIPTITDGNYPKGILIEDEFKGEDNQLYVIFRPIENGKEREDLAYTIPSRLLAKADSR